MGELFLVLIIVGAICGGVPLLAFAYMDGTLKFPGRKSSHTANKTYEAGKSTPKVFMFVILVLGAVFGCFCFPVFNLTKEFSSDIRMISIGVTVMAYYEIGILLEGAFPYKKGSAGKTSLAMVAFNCLHIFAGMGCRYLLEFGEASNRYNFTVPNIILHLIVVNVICMSSWLYTVKKHQKNSF